MEISIRTRDVEITTELEALVARRVQLALDAFGSRVDEVSVYFADLNGPRHGIDKLCQITARVQGIGEVMVLEKGTTTGGALSRAARRLKYSVSQEVDRTTRPSTESIRTGLNAG
jgi:hypothetical protein